MRIASPSSGMETTGAVIEIASPRAFCGLLMTPMYFARAPKARLLASLASTAVPAAYLRTSKLSPVDSTLYAGVSSDMRPTTLPMINRRGAAMPSLATLCIDTRHRARHSRYVVVPVTRGSKQASRRANTN